MNIFGGNSPWGTSPFVKGRSLGQMPLILGPGSWGAGMIPMGPPPQPMVAPPYYGEWGVADADGRIVESGREGPFDTAQEAFDAAAKAANDHGAASLPENGFAQVKDSRGNLTGPIT